MADDPSTASGMHETVSAGSLHFATDDRVDRYVIRRLIGEGGFGLVYEAAQTDPVKRSVALKIIKPGMDSQSVLSRFEAERQALALMNHPCIAKVLDGGATSPAQGSRPYFVMELVEGLPITDHCDRQRLTIDERVALFVRVCDAVQHAHSKGVVHRDLKPSNVLVGYSSEEHAAPKVIDFGVAKALNQRLTAQTIFTEHGQMIGTPEYMSPEQAEMSGQDIDTRADIYSLGVLLYELIAGVPPFDAKSLRQAALAEVQRIIRESTPPRPSTRLSTLLESAEASDLAAQILTARQADPRSLTGILRRDLDWVVMKCLEKDRDRRYQSASSLGRELERYLKGEPVEAGPPTAAYRFRKWARRHRTSLAVAGLVGVVGVAGLSATLLAQLEAYRERQNAYQWAERLDRVDLPPRLIPEERKAEAQQARSEWLARFDALAPGDQADIRALALADHPRLDPSRPEHQTPIRGAIANLMAQLYTNGGGALPPDQPF